MTPVELRIGVDDPRAADVTALLEAHLAFAREVTPPEDIHALDIDGLLDPLVTLFSARADGELFGVGALRRLDGTHAELKSMHTHQAARGKGVGRAMVEHLLGFAADLGYRRVSLETGTMDAFAPSRALYASAGFVRCEPFGEHTVRPASICMTIEIPESTSA